MCVVQVLARHSGVEAVERQLKLTQNNLRKSEEEREETITELRLCKEDTNRQLAELRCAMEKRIAALVDKAFTLADPEVHRFVIIVVRLIVMS